MHYWEDLLHTAMLGTDKKRPDTWDWPPALRDAATSLPSAADAPETLLSTAALAFNFRQCSIVAVPVPDATIQPAAPEQLPYCRAESMAVLAAITDTGSEGLLGLWLDACSRNRQVVQPESIPLLLETAVQQKQLRMAVMTCCGNRGQWLARFNPRWHFGSAESPEAIWQTGTLQQRVQVLAAVRAEDPGKALDWLKTTWPQEDATTKTALLQVMEVNISRVDLDFLEGLASEKSKKVKEAVLALLRLIPESAIVQAYQQLLQQSISLKKERALLGLVRKTKLQLQLPEQVDESIYRSGIDPLSKDPKAMSDARYLLQQLAAQVPPVVWEQHLGESREAILQLLEQEEQLAHLPEAIGRAAVRFRDLAWLQVLLRSRHRHTVEVAAMPLLPAADRELLAMSLLNRATNDAFAAVEGLLTVPIEWSLLLTRKILDHIRTDPWRYNQAFFNRHIHLLPVAILPELETAPSDNQWQRQQWNSITDHIKRLLEIKQQIQSSFTS